MLPQTWVIPLGTGSRNNDVELLFMLRGLHTHHPDASPVVIGEKPVWYKGPHIPFRDDPIGVKENNIRLKVLHAASLYPEFVFSNDDHFLLKPFSGDNYYQHNLAYFNDLLFGGIYKLCIMNTIKLCGNSFPYYDVHTPIVINSETFLKHCSCPWSRNSSYVLKTFYAYHANLSGTPYTDVGLKNPHDLSELKNLLSGKNMFTVVDPVAMTKGLLNFLNQTYPVRSPWE